MCFGKGCWRDKWVECDGDCEQVVGEKKRQILTVKETDFCRE